MRSLDLEGQTIYDVGAFVGLFTLFFARRAADTGQVVAFEPHPGNYERALEHVRLNGFENVTVRNIGLGKERGDLRLAAPAVGLGQATAHEELTNELAARGAGVEIITVPVNSLDQEIHDSSLAEPDFVKIDVEGLELDVLEGMSATVARRKPRLFVEVHGLGAEAKRANAARVVRRLSDYGYSIYHVESDQPVDPSTSDRVAEGHVYCQ